MNKQFFFGKTTFNANRLILQRAKFLIFIRGIPTFKNIFLGPPQHYIACNHKACLKNLTVPVMTHWTDSEFWFIQKFSKYFPIVAIKKSFSKNWEKYKQKSLYVPRKITIRQFRISLSAIEWTLCYFHLGD